MPVSQATLLSETPESVADVRHERHETSALDGGCDGMLRRRGATRLATADDFALTAREFLEQFDVLVIDVHRTHTLAVRAKGIALLAVNLSLGTFTIDTIFLECRRFGHEIDLFNLLLCSLRPSTGSQNAELLREVALFVIRLPNSAP